MKQIETLRQVFIRDSQISCEQSVMLVFSIQLYDLYSPQLPLSPSLSINSPPSFPVWTQCVCVWGGGGFGIHLETIFCGSFTLCTVYDQIQNLKIDKPSQTKAWKGWGLRQINTCRKVPIQDNIFRWRYFDILYCLLWVLSFFALYHQLYPSPETFLLKYDVQIRPISSVLFWVERNSCSLLLYIGWNPTSEAKPEEIILRKGLT